MHKMVFYSAGHTASLGIATARLKQCGYDFSNKPNQDVTHLLLPVPSFEPDGSVKGGGNLEELLKKLPADVHIIGGNLTSPLLQPYGKTDLLQDPLYTAKNAYISAHCAMKMAFNLLPITLDGCPVLVIGWGRIGKCLALLLKQLGANVTVAARNPETRAILTAMGYASVDTTNINTDGFRLIYNTVPVMLLPQCSGNGLKIDLASKPGLGGLDIIWARGLPDKHVPESSGMLIAQTVMRLIENEEKET